MKSIIVYNTATGHTRLIASKMKEVLEKHHHECIVYRDKAIKNIVKANPHYFEPYDLICFGSCTHGGSPAISFKKFLRSIKGYDLKDKSLVCFSSSAGPDIWKQTCNEIKNAFPEMNHVGNFGCQSKNLDSTINNFEELVKSIK